MDLPAIDLSLVVTLPKLIGPDFQRCANRSNTTTPTGARTRSPPSTGRSTPRNREHTSPTRSSDSGDQRRINRRQAAYALLDLHSRSTRFIAASLLEAVAVSIGVNRPQPPAGQLRSRASRRARRRAGRGGSACPRF
jgi:hypothetical protein